MISRDRPYGEKVLLLALSDDYWTPFVVDFAKRLAELGIEYVVAVDSRAGEYQSYGGPIEYGGEVYYFSDFVRRRHGRSQFELTGREDVEIGAMFSDYFRLLLYGAKRHLMRVDWVELKALMAEYFDEIFSKERIGVVVHDQVSTSFSYVCYCRAKAVDIDYFGLCGGRLSDGYELRESIYDESARIEEILDGIVSGTNPIRPDETRWAAAYLAGIDHQLPSYMQDNSLNKVALRHHADSRKLRSFIRKVRYQLSHRKEVEVCSFREPPVQASCRSLLRNIKRTIAARTFRRLEEHISPEWLDKNRYFIYPVHYQPEASTSIGSPEYVDQLNVVRNIAFSLPENAWLLVKEHQSAVGFTSMEFYKEVKRLPKVKLLGPQWNMRHLIRKSSGVITLTSTAGFEALLIGKPVYLFGRTFFEAHPQCHRVESWEQLKHLLRNDQANGRQIHNVDFLVAYRRYTRPGSINYQLPSWGIGEDLSEMVRAKLVERSMRLQTGKVPCRL